MTLASPYSKHLRKCKQQLVERNKTMTNTREEVALLPCPFCGNMAIMENGHNEGTITRYAAFIKCNGCHARMPSGQCNSLQDFEDLKRVLAKDWNTRHEATKQPTPQSTSTQQPTRGATGMTEIFDERYKEVLKCVSAYDMPLRFKAVCLLEELDNMDDDSGAMTYGTMVQALFELAGVKND